MEITTIKKYLNAGDAAVAKSLLEAAGIEALITDDATGYSYANGGLRLQVAASDADRARRVIDDPEEFPPLPDDFVPPEQTVERPVVPRSPGWKLAFLVGGISALIVFPLLSVVSPSLPAWAIADVGGWILLFAFGGSIAVIIRRNLSESSPMTAPKRS